MTPPVLRYSCSAGQHGFDLLTAVNRVIFSIFPIRFFAAFCVMAVIVDCVLLGIAFSVMKTSVF